MRRIIITPEGWNKSYLRRTLQLLNSGAEYLHLRTVGASESQLRDLIECVPPEYRERISIHEHLGLAIEYNLGGVHLNSRFPEKPAGFEGRVSKSCHSISELKANADADYLFLSPIFDSISKQGYKSAFSEKELLEAKNLGIINSRVIALGGMTPNRIPYCKRLGFGGIALMGAAFTPINLEKIRLQFITPDIEDDAVLVETVDRVVKGGCRWVQLRLKNSTTERWLRVAPQIASICRAENAVFLLNDRVDLVESVGADGVHLGKSDMPIDKARSILGPGYIIGGTANTIDDIICHANRGADYIGLGPLRFTRTKKNLSPILGYDGYRTIVSAVRRIGENIPIVGIGGVTPADINAMNEAGVNGLAVCGAINDFL